MPDRPIVGVHEKPVVGGVATVTAPVRLTVLVPLALEAVSVTS